MYSYFLIFEKNHGLGVNHRLVTWYFVFRTDLISNFICPKSASFKAHFEVFFVNYCVSSYTYFSYFLLVLMVAVIVFFLYFMAIWSFYCFSFCPSPWVFDILLCTWFDYLLNCMFSCFFGKIRENSFWLDNYCQLLISTPNL